jgi:hypothetical protein
MMKNLHDEGESRGLEESDEGESMTSPMEVGVGEYVLCPKIWSSKSPLFSCDCVSWEQSGGVL